MPTASRSVRKLRRIKRERSIAFRLLDLVTKQRDGYRNMANMLGAEIERRDAPVEPKEPSLTITKIDEEAPAQLEEVENMDTSV